MREPIFKQSILFLAGALALFVLFAVSCGGTEEAATGGGSGGPGDTTGVTDTAIKIGTLTPLTGTMAPWGIPISKGMQAYFDWINQQGGIYGRKITVDVGDSGYTGRRRRKPSESSSSKTACFWSTLILERRSKRLSANI